jgi:hypothetical protein
MFVTDLPTTFNGPGLKEQLKEGEKTAEQRHAANLLDKSDF